MTIQAKRLKTALNKFAVTANGEPFKKSIYTPKKRGEFTTIEIHADALTADQIAGLYADLPGIDIFNSLGLGFSILRY